MPIESGNYFSLVNISFGATICIITPDSTRAQNETARREKKKWKLSEKDFQMNGNSFKSYLPLFSGDSALPHTTATFDERIAESVVDK